MVLLPKIDNNDVLERLHRLSLKSFNYDPVEFKFRVLECKAPVRFIESVEVLFDYKAAFGYWVLKLLFLDRRGELLESCFIHLEDPNDIDEYLTHLLHNDLHPHGLFLATYIPNQGVPS